ncbi:gamma-glutamyl-gamma-aminobutyrate hydrolase family protein [Aquibacillus kalidii]|uniref:gamma-glutamyl-gamma-aminobutyrate hydrolase family protein n=1 Tax=Aquibacillus kalidii TaxID=2762597 RepID=UPI001645A7D4|nr:gamma-glutamyl-gamma-aminobutyrate hydrolase family protein [Aquibacillus kalidii]
MSRPIIGISGSTQIDEGGRFPGSKRAYVYEDYVRSTERAGGVPFILPVMKDVDSIKQQVAALDGIIISGGDDVNPLMYGVEPHILQGEINPERDAFDEQLIKAAVEANKPILAICRGMQILNVVFGGTLYQDLSYIDGSYIKHDQYSGPSYPSHSVSIEPDSFLYTIFEDKVTMINSFHHQAVKDIAHGFKVTARAKDRVVEAIEKDDDSSFVIGVQWHPEMMTESNSQMLALFEALIGKAK